MKIVDTNVLIYAIHPRSVHHAAIRPWWESALSDSEPVGIPWTVILGFLRITTSPRIFTESLSTDEAIRHVGEWLAIPTVEVLREKPDHAALLFDLIGKARAAGNMVMDAHLAALAISYDATLYSCDSDFARFPGLRWINPLPVNS